MAFTCQRDSYLTTLETVVISCDQTEFSYNHFGKKQKGKGYGVILQDTILFPEGGGQPFDQGKIANADVIAVLRRGEKAIHYTSKPVPVGETVVLNVDWKRRFDHMQQHSAQHLVTAIAQSNYSYETTSWNLGEKTSSIEMDTPDISDTQLKELEYEANCAIRKCIPVTVKTINVNESCEEIDLNIKDLPVDAAGPIRIVSIDGIDNNLCCGTHVKNTSDLQMIKLLGVEKGKKGKTLVNFIAGNRILMSIERDVERQKEFTKVLSGGVEDHVLLVQKVHKQAKDVTRINKTILKELALKEVDLLKTKLNQSLQKENLFIHHNSFGNLEYMNVLSDGIYVVCSEILVFLTVGDENASGLFLISGAVTVVTDSVITTVLEMLDGKGVLKNGKCHGKANNLKNIPQVADFFKQMISKT